MDVHTAADTTLPRPNALLAAYQVCHDMCCSMVLEILHAQAHKLAARVGGLWATQLVVNFHKESQASSPLHKARAGMDGLLFSCSPVGG